MTAQIEVGPNRIGNFSRLSGISLIRIRGPLDGKKPISGFELVRNWLYKYLNSLTAVLDLSGLVNV